MSSESNKRIAKNTLALYVRTFIMMFVSLYTSRLVLKTLGEIDFGVYNLVGGIVILFTFLNNTLSSATQRFLSFELGKKDERKANQVFCASFSINLRISLLILILSETIGLWFVNYKLNIPTNRMFAANIIYQLSIATACIQIIKIPYNSTIIAYEKMTFFAYIGVIETMLKLLFVTILTFITFDSLITYSIFTFLIYVFLLIICVIYCKKKFSICIISNNFEKKLYKKILNFSGWSLFGSIADIGNIQGINIIINIFVGVIANAAIGVMTQLNGAVYMLVTSFQTAFRPQIIKYYAAGEKEAFFNLIFRASKFSFLLIFFFLLPISLNLNLILNTWLVYVPKFAAEFTFWSLCYSAIDALSAPLWMSSQATGKIRNYQIIITCFILSNIIFAYIILATGFSPIYVFITKFILNILTHFARLTYLWHQIKFPIRRYCKDVMLKCLLIIILSTPIPLIEYFRFFGWTRFFLTGFTCTILISFFIYLIGLNKNEQLYLQQIIKNKLRK